MTHGQTKANRRAVVEDVHGVAGEPGNRREPVHDVSEAIERVSELGPAWRGGESEARQVGGDHVEVVPQGRDQVAEHVGRRRESVKQEQRGGRVGPRFSAEDLQAVHIDEAVSRHRCPSSPTGRTAADGLLLLPRLYRVTVSGSSPPPWKMAYSGRRLSLAGNWWRSSEVRSPPRAQTPCPI